MNTEQSYVGRGHHANPTNPTVEKTTQTAQNRANSPLSPDQRQQCFFEAQTKLLDLVDEFMFEETLSGPIELINDLLFHWLANPAIDGALPDMTSEGNRMQLFRAFELVKFLAKAYELQVTGSHCKEKEGGE